jgi:hypothetical protein
MKPRRGSPMGNIAIDVGLILHCAIERLQAKAPADGEGVH